MVCIRSRVMMPLAALLWCWVFFALSHAREFSGKVVDKSGSPIQGAAVLLTKAGKSTVTGADGAWRFALSLGVEQHIDNPPLFTPVLKGNRLYFTLSLGNEPVRVSIHTLDNRLVATVIDRTLAAGVYGMDLLAPALDNQVTIVKVETGGKTTWFKLPVLHKTKSDKPILRRVKESEPKRALTKTAAVIDTLKVSKDGYIPAALPVESYVAAPLTITLSVVPPFYYRDPPDPCGNQFFVEGCKWDEPETTCGGKCAVANACSPPESPNKAGLDITFICPRFMLFSREMVQAAKDDAKLYNWGGGEDSPFNYAIVGHDADVGGLDNNQSSCCQCYQLIYETPEPSSPKPPELPYPKSLVVQSFNTAASGPKGFDVFMGAGGYGAFNACYNDQAFGNTTNFDEFIYDKYPHQNPNAGGISFLRYPACIGKWPPTMAALQSAACQDQITQQCNQALVNASPEITEDTKKSCIQSNQPASLYHQNWEVRAKRVRCPENLTRVTGCRLKEENLPLPLPDVQTPARAESDAGFKKGYHTTTMQDCCKPTCAWTDWVGAKGLPVDGEWNSFYSCDKNGKVLTKSP